MDCIEGMKSIPDNTIDAIICDLPYGVLNKKSEGGGLGFYHTAKFTMGTILKGIKANCSNSSFLSRNVYCKPYDVTA